MSKRRLKPNRRPAGSRIFLRITIGLVLVIAVASAVAIYFDQESQMERVQAESQALKNTLEEAQARYDELKELQDMVDSDEYIERVARDQLGMVRPGEYIFED